jgi:hypothetical protein
MEYDDRRTIVEASQLVVRHVTEQNQIMMSFISSEADRVITSIYFGVALLVFGLTGIALMIPFILGG